MKTNGIIEVAARKPTVEAAVREVKEAFGLLRTDEGWYLAGVTWGRMKFAEKVRLLNEWLDHETVRFNYG